MNSYTEFEESKARGEREYKKASAKYNFTEKAASIRVSLIFSTNLKLELATRFGSVVLETLCVFGFYSVLFCQWITRKYAHHFTAQNNEGDMNEK